MTHFRVNQAVSELTADQRAAADAGADRDVDDSTEPLSGSPARFAEHRAVDVCVEADWHSERLAQWADDVCVAPAALRGGRDVTVTARIPAQLEWTEATYAKRVDLRLGAEELETLVERFLRCRGWKASLRSQIFWASPDSADELGPTRLDRSVQRHGLAHHHATRRHAVSRKALSRGARSR